MPVWLNANLDYLVYVVGGIAVFALLDLWLRRRTPHGRLPRWTWPAAALLLAVGWYFVDEAGEAEHARIQGFLQGVAPTYAQEIERMGHARLTLDTPADDPAYLAMIDATLRWKKVNPTIADVYTYRMIGGKVRFIVDSETDYNHDGKFEGLHERRVPIGREYAEADPGMKQALQGIGTFSPDPVRDEWGVWISAQVPLRDAQGRVEAALAVDYPAARWITAIALGRQRMEWFLSIPLLILGFGAAVTGVLRAELGARRAVEARLSESEARLRTAIDNLPCDFWMMDGSLRYTLLNAASREHWGDHVGRGLDDLKIAQATRVEWADVNRRAFAGETVKHEVTYELRGRQHHYSSVVAPVRVDGKVLAILGVNFDVTDHVETENALRRSEEKLALHVRQTPLAVIEWNLEFRVTAWNPSAERIFGFSAAEAMGRHAVGLIVGEAARPQVERIWAALLTHKGGTRSTNENVTKDGRIIRCEWYNTPLIDRTGVVIGVASSVQDVTESELLQKQLHQAQKMESIGQLAGGVAHEFNNLLTPMFVQSDMLAFHYAHDAKLVAMLHPIQEAIQQAAQLNQRILAVGRHSAEQRELQPLNPLVENAVELLRPGFDRRVELVVDLAPGLPPVLVDRAHVAQIVMNLALNARDTLLEKLADSPPRGWVPRVSITTIATNSAGRRDGASSAPFAQMCQRLTVTDNGRGIPADVGQRIFEPFFTTKEPGHGTGLGLAVVWNVVHGLGGWIEFEPGPGGEGTSFHVFLPLPDVPAAFVGHAPAAPAAPAFKFGRKSARPLRVLLVEDNALVTETFTAMLTASGHTVTAAQDGEAGWETFKQRGGEFDLVLADYNMPRLNGADLLQRIKSAGFAGRVVIVSGYLTTEKLDELKRLGADAVLRKPFTPAKLLEAIEPAVS